jgi:N-glycosylase/DNA lyase
MELLNLYRSKKKEIRKRLEDFRKLNGEDMFKEFIFCLLTPQSNAQKCWEAVEELSKLNNPSKDKINEILKTKTRFHNNKTLYVLAGFEIWKSVRKKLESEKDPVKLRAWLAENVKGYGLKEAGHFLRNIGKSDNKVAILDRHILRNLLELRKINEDKINGKKDYFEKERKFAEFSEKIGIPLDELDLLFWSKENGEIFK